MLVKNNENQSKAYGYLIASIRPIDNRFNTFITDLKQMGKENAIQKSEEVQIITTFYQYLFEIVEPYDSSYTSGKPNQITNDMMKATQ